MEYFGTREMLSVVNKRYRTIDGRPVERNTREYPYSYSNFVIWKGSYKKGDEVIYTDRLRQWDYDKYNQCCLEVFGNTGQYFNNREPKDIEKFLSMYLDKRIELTGIEEACNYSNGYPYWILYYRELEG